MKIEYVDKYDLYKKGNYIGSFDSYDEILKYFERKFNDWTRYYGNYNNALRETNDSRYTVIHSKHLNFSWGDN